MLIIDVFRSNGGRWQVSQTQQVRTVWFRRWFTSEGECSLL